MKRNSAYKIQEFAESLQNYLDSPGPFAKFGMPDFDDNDPNVQQILTNVAVATRAMAQVAKEVEFYLNGDITEEIFLKRYKALEQKLNTELASVTG